MSSHGLRCWPSAFAAVLDGRKRYELRYDDRDYQVGDELELLEYDPDPALADDDHYTGRELKVTVTYISTRSSPPAVIRADDDLLLRWPLSPGFVVLGISEHAGVVYNCPGCGSADFAAGGDGMTCQDCGHVIEEGST